MTCNTLFPYTQTVCGAVKAGVRQHKVFICRYEDLQPVYEDSVYDFDDHGVVNNIQPKFERYFTKIESTRKSISFTETQTLSESNVETIENQFQIGLDRFSVENSKFTSALSGVPVVIIFQLNQGQWVGIGLDGEFELRSSILTVNNENNSRILTFQSEVSNMMYQIDDSIIIDLIIAPIVQWDGFNYLLDFSFSN